MICLTPLLPSLQVKCFYCDGGLREWRAEDDPWEEHAGWFRDCGFVRLVRGDTFVEESVQAVRSTVVGGGDPDNQHK